MRPGKENRGRGLLFVVVATALLSSCASIDALSDQAASRFDDCEDDSRCRVAGTLTIVAGVPYSGAFIETAAGECVPAVLAPKVINERRMWNGRQVVAEGVKLLRAPVVDGVISTKYRDRWAADRTCPATVGSVLYVDWLARR